MHVMDSWQIHFNGGMGDVGCSQIGDKQDQCCFWWWQRGDLGVLYRNDCTFSFWLSIYVAIVDGANPPAINWSAFLWSSAKRAASFESVGWWSISTGMMMVNHEWRRGHTYAPLWCQSKPKRKAGIDEYMCVPVHCEKVAVCWIDG